MSLQTPPPNLPPQQGQQFLPLIPPRVENKPLIDDGRWIEEASRHVPIEPVLPHHLNPHFGGHRHEHRDPPKAYAHQADFVTHRGHLYPDDSLAFGGYSGVDFLQRNTKSHQ